MNVPKFNIAVSYLIWVDSVNRDGFNEIFFMEFNNSSVDFCYLKCCTSIFGKPNNCCLCSCCGVTIALVIFAR